jgi:hypothetical protein
MNVDNKFAEDKKRNFKEEQRKIFWENRYQNMHVDKVIDIIGKSCPEECNGLSLNQAIKKLTLTKVK